MGRLSEPRTHVNGELETIPDPKTRRFRLRAGLVHTGGQAGGETLILKLHDKARVKLPDHIAQFFL